MGITATPLATRWLPVGPHARELTSHANRLHLIVVPTANPNSPGDAPPLEWVSWNRGTHRFALFPDAGLGGYARRVILNPRFPFSQVVAQMARKMRVFLQDDIDGGTATQTVSFAVDGTDYEIDLSDQNAKKLRDSMAPWVAAARPVDRSNRRAGVSANVVDLREGARRGALPTSEIRRWAIENGIAISNRGRIPNNVRTQFEAAHVSTMSPN